MRESILEAVEESEGSRSGGRLPLAGALFGLGAAVGFLVGRQSPELEESPIDDLEEPEIIEDVMESTEATDETTAEVSEESDASSTSRLPRLLLAVGVLAGAAFLRRRLAREKKKRWEPIEEFEPATSGDAEEETESEQMEEADAEEAGEESEE